MIDDGLYAYMREMLDKTPTQFRRSLYSMIDWDDRLLGITGPRGTGKSTMIKQRIIDGPDTDKCLYVSADHLFFSTHTLVSLADDAVKENYQRLFIDEIHKYKGWSTELKQIYDTHPDLKVVFTGSSILEISKGEADLSRRAIMYNLQGLSFREYLELFKGIKANVYSFEETVSHKVTLEGLEHPLPVFRDYLAGGYYPFALEGKIDIRLLQTINQTIESDIAQYANLNAATVRKLKQLLAIVSTLVPYKPNMLSLAGEIGVSKNNVADYLSHLEKAGLIGQLRDDTGGIRGLGKVEKVYLDNPTLMTVLSDGKPDIVNLRETFFYNQVRLMNDVTSSRESDFKVNGRTVEIGGPKKGNRQIANAEGGIIAKDEIEYGHGNIVPLWQLGFSY